MNINNYMTVKEAAYRWNVDARTLREKLNIQRRPALQKDMDNGLVKYFKAPDSKQGEWMITRRAMRMWYGEEVNKPAEKLKEDGKLKEFPRTENDFLDVEKLIEMTSEEFYQILVEDNPHEKIDKEKHFRVYYWVDAIGNMSVWTKKQGVIVLKSYEYRTDSNESIRNNGFSALDVAVYLKIFKDHEPDELIHIHAEKL